MICKRMKSTICRATLAIALAVVGVAAPTMVHAHHFGGSGTPDDDGLPPDDPCGGNGQSPAGAGTDPAAGGSEGDPVRVASGRYTLTRTDLTVLGVFPIEFRRSYDSRSLIDTPVGAGWTHNFNARLFDLADGTVMVRKLCGGVVRYSDTGSATLAPQSPLTTDILRRNPDGSYTLRNLDGMKSQFDARGRLSAVEDRVGNRLELSYQSDTRTLLTAASRFGITPQAPSASTLAYQLQEVRERTADGNLTGRSISLAYDAQTGRLRSVTASDGRTVQYQHDIGALPSDQRGNLERVVGLEGIVELYGYGDPRDARNITSAQFAQEMAPLVLTYDKDDRVVRQTLGDSVIQFDYSVPLQTTVKRTVVDEQRTTLNVSSTLYKYDSRGLMMEMVDPAGHRFVNVRDSEGRRTAFEVYPAGSGAMPERRESFTYYANGQLKTEEVVLDDGEKITRSLEYDQGLVSAVQVVSSKDPAKIFRTETVWNHDALGLPTVPAAMRQRLDDGTFVATIFTSNVNGQAEGIEPPAIPGEPALRFRKSYYPTNGPSAGGLFESFIELDGVRVAKNARTVTYDDRMFVASIRTPGALVSDPERVTTLEFDDMGRPLIARNPLGEQTIFSYRGPTAGRADDEFLDGPPGFFLVQTEQGRKSASEPGRIRRFAIDGLGRLRSTIRSTSVSGAPVFESMGSATYDSEGNMLSLSTASGRTRTYEYDERGALKAMTYDGRTTLRSYDADGRVTRIVDPDGGQRSVEFDDDGRPIRFVVSAGAKREITSVTYDAAGNRTSITDSGGETTRYELDALSQLDRVTDPLGKTIEFRYDVRGQNTHVVNSRGNVIYFKYSPLGSVERIEERTVDGGSVSRWRDFDYDLQGNLRAVVDSAIDPAAPSYTFDFDRLDRPIQQVAHYLPAPGGGTSPRTLTVTYDRFGKVASEVFDDLDGTLSQTFEYDGANRLIGSVLPSGKSVAVEYEADDLLSGVVFDGSLALRYAYDGSGALRSISLKSGAAPGIQQYMLSYTRNPDGTIESYGEETTAGSVQGSYGFQYDGLGRITEATYSGDLPVQPIRRVDYDDAGNIIDPDDPAGFEYDANDRLVRTPDGRTYEADEDGNVTRVTLPSGGAIDFSYNPQGEVTSIASSATGTAARFVYDPFGRKISSTVNGETTFFLWDSDRIYAEYDGETGERTTRYEYLTGTEPVALATGARGNEVVLVSLIGHDGAPRVLADSSGALMWRAGYDAFGNASVDPNPDGDEASVEYAPRGGGAQDDKRLQLRATTPRGRPRTNAEGSPEIDPDLGRTMSPEPGDRVSGQNPYQYAPPTDVGDGSDLFDALGPFSDQGTGFGLEAKRRFERDPCPSPGAAGAGKGDGAASSLVERGQNIVLGFFYSLYQGKVERDDALDLLQILLGLAGEIPGLGIAPDLTDASISAARGNFFDALAALAAAAPVLGQVAGVARNAKRLKKLSRVIDSLESIGKGLRKVCPRCRCGCFTENTEVWTVDGLVPIGEVKVGDRVETPESFAVADRASGMRTNVNESWRTLDLTMPDQSNPGSVVELTILKSPEWLVNEGVSIGGTVPIDMPELGLEGLAQVHAIRAPPRIQPGPGRVVLMTISRDHQQLLAVALRGDQSPLEVTANHLLYSESRGGWVAARSVRPDEHLRTSDGTVVVESVSSMKGRYRVFNLEVETEHEYYVAKEGVRAHNSCFSDKEQAVADFLRALGRKVEKNPLEGVPGAGRQGDAFVDGLKTEFKTLDPSDTASSNTVKNALNRAKKGRAQAPEVVVDARKTNLTEAAARQGLRDGLKNARGKINYASVLGNGFFIGLAK